jgi:hypothetical protein
MPRTPDVAGRFSRAPTSMFLPISLGLTAQAAFDLRQPEVEFLRTEIGIIGRRAAKRAVRCWHSRMHVCECQNRNG